ncbi:MAG: bifunctional demethylmenaquinone methyltransferase/2-methoxy-6-polyprenyl-1,4-benzoquinol methylase UbiE [Bacteroidales bacterium]|nr:bifunctional demethylmenaquinone methyltransferase/2-methoxy-6-polyprenyl-1,4-benzoquinol methylase UbiE [Bacteroidales bacterium]
MNCKLRHKQIIKNAYANRAFINNYIFAVCKFIRMRKKEEVRIMFDSIAWRYDFLNHFLSFGTDLLWRRKAVNEIAARIKPARILDLATGTCDLAIEALRLKPEKVTAVDISQRMLEEGRKKLYRKKLHGEIELMIGDSEELPFDDTSFDTVMVSFGIRNFEDAEKGLSEMYRVLREKGVVMILEFSRPTGFPFKYIYGFYFRKVLPFFGALFSKDRAAYNYLPNSVSSFPEGDDFLSLMEGVGFGNLKQRRLTGGVASIYTAEK